ncbi:MAG: protein kinase [Blastocatellales bacterium]
MIGRIIGNYRITSELAHGGMGTVYRGQHVHLPREIVVKSILLGAYSPSAQSHLKARFRREAYIQSQLDHPNIVRVYEFFAAEDNYYLVMEYVPGMSLRDLLARQGVPTPAQAVYLCKQALTALDYAHNYIYVDESDIRHTGIIHRDIKPANMLLDHKGKLKITDFGIVKVMGEQHSGGMTQTGFHPGTVEYMSPEQLLGLDIDVRSDLYSLGVTFYEMLTGRLPFQRSATGSDWEVRKGHIEVEPPPILSIRPDIPPTLAAIIMRMLQKNPNERFQTAAELMEALQIHERTVGEDSITRGASGRLTKPITAPANTGEDLSLVSRPATSKPFPSSNPSPSNPALIVSPVSTEIPKSSGAAFDEAETMPLSQNKALKQEKQEASNPKPIEANMFANVAPSRSKGRLGLAAAALGLLLAGTAAGAYLFSNQQSQEKLQNVAAQIEATPTPVTGASATPRASVKPKTSPTVQPSPTPDNRPAPVPTPEINLPVSGILNQAKALEDREQYAEAIAKYREFQSSNPGSAEAELVNSKLLVLNGIRQLLADAEADMNSKRYLAARERYRNVLRVKPESQIARTGLAEASAKMAESQLMNPPQSPFSPRDGEPRRIPPTLKKRPKPNDPLNPDRPL